MVIEFITYDTGKAERFKLFDRVPPPAGSALTIGKKRYRVVHLEYFIDGAGKSDSVLRCEATLAR